MSGVTVSTRSIEIRVISEWLHQHGLARGDVTALAHHHTKLHATLPDLRVIGGCCGTDHEHVAAIALALNVAI